MSAQSAVGHTAAPLDADSTRARIRALVVSQGPIDASRLAAELDVTPAGVRRHLQALVAAGEIAERAVPVTGPRGRGRPPREYVATTGAQEHLPDASAELAVEALDFIASALGEPGVTQFADDRLAELERYRPLVEKLRVGRRGPRRRARRSTRCRRVRCFGAPTTR